MSLFHDTGITSALGPAYANAASRHMIERRLREVFWRGLPVYGLFALLLLSGGWWLLGIASTRYGAGNAVPEVAHYVLGLGVGQVSALAYATARLTPAAYLDVMHRHVSSEWRALQAMRMDAPTLVCAPWLIAGTLTAAGYWSLYYAVYLAVESWLPDLARLLGLRMVAIDSGEYSSLRTLALTLPCAVLGGFVATWVTLALGSRERRANTRRVSALGLRAFMLALGAGALSQGALYAMLSG